MYKACYFHIRALYHIRSSMLTDTANVTACSIVSTRLDFCNALLVSALEKNLYKLQLIQSTQVNVAMETHWWHHITLVFAELYLLPVWDRTTFIITILVFKIELICQPSYLACLIMDYKSLWNQVSFQIITNWTGVHHRTCSTFFPYSSARSWKGFQNYIRTLNNLSTLQKELKTHLFRLYYCS